MVYKGNIQGNYIANAEGKGEKNISVLRFGQME